MQALDDVMEASVTSAQDDLSRAQWQFTHNNSWGGKEGGRVLGVCNHTDTTGSHVGGNHDGALARLEFVQDPVALVLLLVAVNSWRCVSSDQVIGCDSTYKAPASRPDEGIG
jgi:hypothetical protein